MTSPAETTLKFLVPAATRADLVREIMRVATSVERSVLATRYLDTPDRLLARAGLSWRLRHEGRRWIQTLQAAGAHPLERFAHEVIRPDASHDALLHAGTPAGDRLLALLRRARASGQAPVLRFQTELRRTMRRVRTRGALVAVAFDEGRLLCAGASHRIREVEFSLCTGSVSAMLGLVERWCKRFGLVHDPRSMAERGDRLADGAPGPPVRKAVSPSYGAGASAAEAHHAVLDECLAQITCNAIGLCDGLPALRMEHVHQLRVGIRRLRTALRCFAGWVRPPPDALVAELRALFATLGQSRDGDVMASGVAAELAKAGAPPVALPARASGPDVAAVVASARTQQALLGWIRWRAALDDAAQDDTDQARSAESAAPDTPAEPPPRPFRQAAQRRLRNWHARVLDDLNQFDALDEQALHALRKRIKRLRYTVEFFGPVLRGGKVRRYLRALEDVQAHMGNLNDLFVARARYQQLLADDGAAWFALGWLAARVADTRALAVPALARLASTPPPTA